MAYGYARGSKGLATSGCSRSFSGCAARLWCLARNLQRGEWWLTLPSRGRPTSGFACCRPPLMSNVRAHMPQQWQRASYFNSGTAEARQRMTELELVDRANWYELYRRKGDGSYWRLNADDKYQQR